MGEVKSPAGGPIAGAHVEVWVRCGVPFGEQQALYRIPETVRLDAGADPHRLTRRVPDATGPSHRLDVSRGRSGRRTSHGDLRLDHASRRIERAAAV